jgi:muramoyltetrapeptide carboxypeptidase
MTLNKKVLPSPLKRGATIGVVAPSGRIHDVGFFEKGIRILHEMGFQTKFPRKLWPGSEYFSDSDSERGKEFNRIWNDPEVDAVMAARGGYGCIRMLNSIATENIARKPKFFLGFSDISLLHSHLNNNANLVTLHGPVVTSLSRLTNNSLNSLFSLLMGNLKAWKHTGGMEILRGADTISGISTGGNLSTLVSTLGTQFDTSWSGKIIFLEDTNESLYRIDRMLTQLSLAGKFEEAAAIILGDFSHGLSLDTIEAIRHHETIWKRVLELTNSKTAVWADYPFGHGSLNHTIPFGAEIRLDSGRAEMCSV